MSKPTKILNWATDDIIDPESGQNNKVEPISQLQLNGWIFKQKPPFNNFNYWMNAVYLWIKWLDEEGIRSSNSASYVIASSDSPDSIQNTSNLVISTEDDAGVSINLVITTLNSQGGGTILLREGTYNISTNVSLLSNVNIRGMGNTTILKRNSATLQQVVYLPNGLEFCVLSDFLIDGNGSNYTYTGNAYGIKAQSYPHSSSIFVKNVISKNNKSTIECFGFSLIRNVNNCISFGNYGDGGGYGFYYAFPILNSYAYNNDADSSHSSAGFSNCATSGCISNNNGSVANAGYGYLNCYRMTNNTGTGNKTALLYTCYFSSDNSVAAAAENGNA